MANRRFAMHEIRHVIARMRSGESDRNIDPADEQDGECLGRGYQKKLKYGNGLYTA
ncbi:hypothetical protein MASR1M90_02520 [Desulfovibrionales bacterium]